MSAVENVDRVTFGILSLSHRLNKFTKAWREAVSESLRDRSRNPKPRDPIDYNSFKDDLLGTEDTTIPSTMC